MERRRRNAAVFAGVLMAAVLSAETVAAQGSCPVKVGGVLPLTGSMAPITKKIAQSAELAIEHVNQGGGIKGCPVQFILRDDQGQPTVGVDAAKYLVDDTEDFVELGSVDYDPANGEPKTIVILEDVDP